MRICIFEDKGALWLEPLTLTRPAFDLRCGAMSLRPRQLLVTGADEIGVLVRPELAELCRVTHPDLAVNDEDWLRRGPAVLINARWLPAVELVDEWTAPRAGIVDDQVAYAVLPAGAAPECSPHNIDHCVETWKQTLPHCSAGGAMIDYPWDLVEHNAATLCGDAAWFGARSQDSVAERIVVVGPRAQLMVAPDVHVDPFVVADTRNGPVLIDRGAVIHAFSRLQGPCYVGEETWLFGAKLRGGSLGPHCRIGGEVEASIVHSYSNKYHDGFLGHSYVGEWVNLAAGTQTSDLRNDYGPIKMTLAGERIASGLTKIGAFIGDHSKTALGVLLNTGTVIGAFCNILPTGGLLPTNIPSFCTVRNGQIEERRDLRQLTTTAATVVRRRGPELTGTHIDFLFSLYDQTARRRRDAVRHSELRRLRQSV